MKILLLINVVSLVGFSSCFPYYYYEDFFHHEELATSSQQRIDTYTTHQNNKKIGPTSSSLTSGKNTVTRTSWSSHSNQKPQIQGTRNGYHQSSGNSYGHGFQESYRSKGGYEDAVREAQKYAGGVRNPFGTAFPAAPHFGTTPRQFHHGLNSNQYSNQNTQLLNGQVRANTNKINSINRNFDSGQSRHVARNHLKNFPGATPFANPHQLAALQKKQLLHGQRNGANNHNAFVKNQDISSKYYGSNFGRIDIEGDVRNSFQDLLKRVFV